MCRRDVELLAGRGCGRASAAYVRRRQLAERCRARQSVSTSDAAARSLRLQILRRRRRRTRTDQRQEEEQGSRVEQRGSRVAVSATNGHGRSYVLLVCQMM